MSDQTNHTETPTDRAAEEMAQAAEREAEAVEEVAEAVVEEVAGRVAEAGESAQEAATEAAEAIEDAVEARTDAASDLDVSTHGDEVYDRVLARLREDGHIPSGAVAEEIAGEAVDAPEVVAEDLEDTVPPPPVREGSREIIHPRREHWWYRPRRIFGGRGD